MMSCPVSAVMEMILKTNVLVLHLSGKGEIRCSSRRGARNVMLLDICMQKFLTLSRDINPYPTAFPYGNGMVLHFYQQQESSTTKTVHKVINKRLKTYV